MSHLDDLPTRTSEHAGETESREAFKHLFKDPLFIPRNEEENDYGVDLEVEVQMPGQGGKAFPTNIRFHAQLKASTKDSNKDGSYSYSVDRTNLNYLLNHPRSIYVFFVRETGRLLFRWVEDVLTEYERSGDDWRSQATVTVRFQDELDQAAVEAIHKRMLEEAPRERDLRLGMRLQGVYMSGSFSYDPATSQVTDHTKILQIISRSGLAIAAHGHAEDVLRMTDTVAAQLDDSGLLARAYAAYQLSRHGTAFEALRACSPDSLPKDNERALHAFLFSALSRTFGMLDHGEYVEEVRQIQSRFPNSSSAIYARLESLRLDGIKKEGAGYADDAKALATQLQSRGPEWAPLAVQADFVALELRYHTIQRSFHEQVVLYRMTDHLGMADATAGDRAAGAQLLVAEMDQWLKDFELALQVAKGLGIGIILAEGLQVFASCMLQEIIINDKLVPKTPDLATGRNQQIDRTIERIEYAKQLFQKENATEQNARADLLIVEALWLKGQKAEATEKAKEIAKSARQAGLMDIHQRALAIANGQSPIGEFENVPSIYDV